jgi:DNA-binding PadR family transcriptional regulator
MTRGRLSAWLYRLRHRRELATQRVLETLSKGDYSGLGLMRDAHVGAGLLYPILARLEHEGLVESFWEPHTLGPSRPRRRLFRITDLGRQQTHSDRSKA